jgi:hypothetical protein
MSKKFQSKLTLETYDAKTGELCDRAEATNFVGQATIRHMKWLQRGLYRYYLSNAGGTDSDAIAPPGPLNSVFLTDSPMAEDAANEYCFPGAMLGWASSEATYAGADSLRGTPNTTTLDAQTGYTKWVFDWPTNAANGTIRSVGFGLTAVTDSIGGSPSRTLVHQAGSVEQVWSTPSFWNYFARANSSQAFAQTSGTNVSVLDASYAQTTTFSVAAQFSSITGLAWDSGNSRLWIIGTSGANKVIAAYNASGVLQTGPFTLTNRTYGYLAFDGTNLWSCVQTSGSSNVTLYQINPTNGTDITNFTTTLPGTDSNYRMSGLCYEPTYQRIWLKLSTITQTTGSDYRRAFLRSFNTAGNVQTPDVSLNPVDMTSTAITHLYSPSTNSSSIYTQDFDIIDAYQFAMPTNWNSINRIARFRPSGLFTRALLGAPVVKANTQTLRLIYQVNYV